MASKGKTKRLALRDIRVDGGTQSRAAIHMETVEEYAEAMQAGDGFPALVVFYDGTTYWLADGFHRHAAALKAKFRTFECEVRQGTQRDAILHSVGANSTHGLRRTNTDKRRAVEVLLRDGEWAQWSDREIARRTGVSDRFVNNMRKEIPTANGSQSGLRKGADGRVIDTTRIGTVGSQAAERRSFEPLKGVFYPIDTIHRLVYNEPFQTAEEIPEGYRPAEGSELKIEVRYHMYRFVDEITPEPEGPKLEKVLWVGGRFYPVEVWRKFIFNHPLTRDEVDEARRVWYPRADMVQTASLQPWAVYEAAGWTLQEKRGPVGGETEAGEAEVEEAGADGEAVPQVDEPSPEHDPQEDGAEGHTKYRAGLSAKCKKCVVHYPGYSPVYDNWKRDPDVQDRVIWMCPHKHRVADPLMNIVEEPPKKWDRPINWLPSLEGRMYYPVNHKLKIVVNDGFDKQHNLRQKYAYGTSRRTFQSQYAYAIWQDKTYAEYRLVEPADLQAVIDAAFANDVQQQPSPVIVVPSASITGVQLPPEKFGAIYSDNAWPHNYPTTPYLQMSLAAMAALPIAQYAADDCALFMWVTATMFRKAFEVADAWGFEYTGVKAFAWVKVARDMSPTSVFRLNDERAWHKGKRGTWTHSSTEDCLLFVKGKPKRLVEGMGQLIIAPVREHSRKPDEAYEMIEQLVAGPYLELFAREKRQGWFVWGNEIESDIRLEAVEA